MLFSASRDFPAIRSKSRLFRDANSPVIDESAGFAVLLGVSGLQAGVSGCII